MTSCVINGHQCTACCRAIVLTMGRRHLKRMGKGGDAGFVMANWKPISKRRAKKKNQHLFTWIGRDPLYKKKDNRFRSVRDTEAGPHFFHCTKVTATGCGVYGERPRVCQDYPSYGRSVETMQARLKNFPPEYHPECTEWEAVKFVPANAGLVQVKTA